jgi:ParB family transcriptional regulator, chromosome partitioning protein
VRDARPCQSPASAKGCPRSFLLTGPLGKPALSVTDQDRTGITLRIYAGSGAEEEHLVRLFRKALLVFLEPENVSPGKHGVS